VEVEHVPSRAVAGQPSYKLKSISDGRRNEDDAVIGVAGGVMQEGYGRLEGPTSANIGHIVGLVDDEQAEPGEHGLWISPQEVREAFGGHHLDTGRCILIQHRGQPTFIHHREVSVDPLT
jgi:hypothetical protein